MTDKSRRLLEESLRKQFSDGLRKTVLVVGSGLHNQVRSHLPDWRTLIANIQRGRSLPITENNPDLTVAWESLISQIVEQRDMIKNRAFAQIEREVLKADLLPQLVGTPPESDELKQVTSNLLSRHRDIVTLNFDRTIDRALSMILPEGTAGVLHPSPTKVIGPTKRPVLNVRVGSQRVWHPHGIAHSKATAPSIQLGFHGYARAVQQVSDGLAGYRMKQKEWMVNKNVTIEGTWPAQLAQEWEEKVRELSESSELRWFEICMPSDLVFIGCGLKPEELDIWLLLHARQRQFARLSSEQRPKAFYIFANSESEKAREDRAEYAAKYAPAGLLPVAFDSYRDMWEFLCGES